MSTEWRARRSRDRLLCGRKAADSNRYLCQGEIAQLMYGSGGRRDAIPRGCVEMPEGSGWWEPSATAQEKLAAGRRAVYKTRTARGGYGVRRPVVPWRRPCPKCKCTALVDSAVLESVQQR